MKYSKDFIDKAVSLSKKKGLEKASNKLNVSEKTLANWVNASVSSYYISDPIENETIKENIDFLSSLVGF